MMHPLSPPLCFTGVSSKLVWSGVVPGNIPIIFRSRAKESAACDGISLGSALWLFLSGPMAAQTLLTNSQNCSTILHT
jgi:hypothetical protein